MQPLTLNYAHPLTDAQLADLDRLVGEATRVVAITAQVDRSRPLAEVAHELADAAGLSPDEWQTTPLLLNPPALAPVALALIAEIHGRCGGFPAIINVRPVPGSVPTRYEVAEVVNLQAIREQARARR